MLNIKIKFYDKIMNEDYSVTMIRESIKEVDEWIKQHEYVYEIKDIIIKDWN